jgi:hypothetical protein
MDAKGRGESVNELGGASISIELGKSPVESDLTQDGIEGTDDESASELHVELEDVADSHISVFSALGLSEVVRISCSVVECISSNDVATIV